MRSVTSFDTVTQPGRFYNLCEEKKSDKKFGAGIKVFRGLEIRLIDNFLYH
jgi:hypothetical protein